MLKAQVRTLVILACVVVAFAARRESVVGVASGLSDSIPISDVNNVVSLPVGSRLHPVKTRITNFDRKVKFKQHHYGVPVYGSILTADQLADGSLTGQWRGQLVQDIEPVPVTPKLSPSQAVLILQSVYGHHLLPSSDVFVRSNASLFVCLDKSNVARLCYLVDYFIESRSSRVIPGLPARPHGLIDAHNRTVIDRWTGLTHTYGEVAQSYLERYKNAILGIANAYWRRTAVPVASPSFAAVNVASQSLLAEVNATPLNKSTTMKITEIPGVGGNMGGLGRRLLLNVKVTMLPDGVTCKYDTNNVQIQHMKSRTFDVFTPLTFRCSDAARDTYDFVNGGYSSLNDAAVNTEVVVAMFKAYTASNGPIGVLPLRARVHYGTRYENAFWDGETMTIGDGAFTFYPLVALDVIAHEYGHGFTSVNSRLQYSYQSGGINEAFSDMAGEAAEYFASGRNDFLIGSTIMKDGSPLRNMCYPSRDGRSIESARQYNNFINVHFSSGVYNKAFCILAKSPGWTTATAFRVFARANDLYWGAQTTFDYGACGVQQAAVDLRLNVTQVTAAFTAVDVRCQ